PCRMDAAARGSAPRDRGQERRRYGLRCRVLQVPGRIRLRLLLRDEKRERTGGARLRSVDPSPHPLQHLLGVPGRDRQGAVSRARVHRDAPALSHEPLTGDRKGKFEAIPRGGFHDRNRAPRERCAAPGHIKPEAARITTIEAPLCRRLAGHGEGALAELGSQHWPRILYRKYHGSVARFERDSDKLTRGAAGDGVVNECGESRLRVGFRRSAGSLCTRATPETHAVTLSCTLGL